MKAISLVRQAWARHVLIKMTMKISEKYVLFALSCMQKSRAFLKTLQRTHKTILKQKLWEQKIANENKVHRSQEMRCNTWCNKGGLHVLPSLWILGRAAFQCQNKVLSADTADL